MIELVQTLAGIDFALDKGERISLSPDKEERWIACGFAKRVPNEPKRKKETPVNVSVSVTSKLNT